MYTKLSQESKKYYERELRQYWNNKNELNCVLSKFKQQKNNHINARVVIYLQEHIEKIEIAIEKLKPYEQDIFEMIFKENLDWKVCKTEKNIDKNSYYNVFNKAIYLLAEEFGEI